MVRLTPTSDPAPTLLLDFLHIKMCHIYSFSQHSKTCIFPGNLSTFNKSWNADLFSLLGHHGPRRGSRDCRSRKSQLAECGGVGIHIGVHVDSVHVDCRWRITCQCLCTFAIRRVIHKLTLNTIEWCCDDMPYCCCCRYLIGTLYDTCAVWCLDLDDIVGYFIGMEMWWWMRLRMMAAVCTLTPICCGGLIDCLCLCHF